MILGSHVSVAGGLDKAVARATAAGCDCIQIFTKNNNRWAAKPLQREIVTCWRQAFDESRLVHPIAHASYLINLASPDDNLFRKSIDALVDEWQRCNLLGLEGLVVHPGAYTKSCEDDGIGRVIDAVVETGNRVPTGSCRLLLENTAGQGTCLGHSIAHLARMLDGIADHQRVGVCLDTCHAFAAGYEINRPAGFAQLRSEIDQQLPPGAVAALHLNDSKKPLGSRIDRHEHIGRGAIGLDGFRLLFADPLFARLPGYLETEKGMDDQSGEDWDVINLRALRQLAT